MDQKDPPDVGRCGLRVECIRGLRFSGENIEALVGAPVGEATVSVAQIPRHVKKNKAVTTYDHEVYA